MEPQLKIEGKLIRVLQIATWAESHSEYRRYYDSFL